MKTIRRYHLQPNKVQSITLPQGSEILSVQAKSDDAPILWALVDPALEEEERTLTLYATGTEVPDDPGRYCGSFLLFDGSLEFHAFETPGPSGEETA